MSSATIRWGWLPVAVTAALVVAWLATDARQWLLLANTFFLSAWVGALVLPLSALLAWLLVRTDLPGRSVVGVLFAVMLFMPLYLVTAAWQAGFGQQGWFTAMMGHFGEAPLLDHWRGAIWIHALYALPGATLIIGLGLWLVEPELEEEALIDGSAPQVFLRVTLPRMLPAMLAAALWAMVTTAGEITVTDMWQLRTFAEEIFIGFTLGETLEEVPWGTLAGIAVVALLVVPAVALCGELAPRYDQPPVRPPWQFRLGAWRWPALLFVVIMLLVLIGVPLVSLLVQAGIEVRQLGDERVRSWSLVKAISITARSVWEFRRELLWSLGVGSVAATATVVIAAPLAWLARRGGWRAGIILLVAAVCLALPGPLIGLGLIRLLNQPHVPLLQYLYDRSILGPTLALVIRALPLTMFVLWHALRSVPRETLASAATEGAGRWRQFLAVALPQRWAALVAAWLVALAVAMGDLSASFLVLPPGVSPLSRRIFELAHYGVEDRLAGICLVTSLLFTLLGLAIVAALRRGWRQAPKL